VIVSASAFLYFVEPEATLKEMRRTLRPGGVLVILDWCKDYLSCQLGDMILKLVDSAYQRCYTQAEFHHLLNSARFANSGCNQNAMWPDVVGFMIFAASPQPRQ
jgi:ubiquinone/menaquinone biosynthesis C-methylase UbiE